MSSRKVFGIGWAKTGTTTLGKCFRILGYNHQSQRLDLIRDLIQGNLERVRSIAEEKSSFEDWPWIILFKELDEMFPDSRFVLTIRDPERWLQSYRNMLKLQKPSTELIEIRRFLYKLTFPKVTDKQLLDRYKSHNEEVREYFKDRPDSLLVVDWEKGDGWKELCKFIGRPAPPELFPHENRGKC